MARHSLSLLSSPFLSPPPNSPTRKPTRTPLLLPTLLRNPFPAFSCCTPPKHSDKQILPFIADSNDASLPCIRAYENDLARFSLVGSVASHQAITAAAADGGRAASDHINSGVNAMVVETVFPGPADGNSTVSTRLFLPAKKVKEKARKLKQSYPEDIFSGNTSENILAMTFRQVVMEELWSFELVFFKPGTKRDMKDLENAREVPPSFVLSSLDEHAVSVLAEVVCVAALQNTEKHFFDEFLGIGSGGFFGLFQKEKRIVSTDYSVVLVKLFEDEIVENGKTLLESFYSAKKSFEGRVMIRKHKWWIPLIQSKLEKIGGPEFSAWTSEYVPAYKLQVRADKFKNVKFDCWRKSGENRWEVLLTHSQMVGLAEILDMYYEDAYSLPNKELSCGVVSNFTNLSNKKNSSSLVNILSVSLASGIFLVTIAYLSQFCFPQLRNGKISVRENKSPPASETRIAVNESADAEKLQQLCISIVKKIKDAFGWHGDIKTETDTGAWIGDLPIYLRSASKTDFSSEKDSKDSTSEQKIDVHMKSTAQDIASYQVVLSPEGNVVGFQPTSRVGVNHWAKNPLAKELYGGRKLSPGFLEPGLKVRLPDEVVVMELLMSENSDACFALVRLVR